MNEKQHLIKIMTTIASNLKTDLESYNKLNEIMGDKDIHINTDNITNHDLKRKLEETMNFVCDAFNNLDLLIDEASSTSSELSRSIH